MLSTLACLRKRKKFWISSLECRGKKRDRKKLFLGAASAGGNFGKSLRVGVLISSSFCREEEHGYLLGKGGKPRTMLMFITGGNKNGPGAGDVVSFV